MDAPRRGADRHGRQARAATRRGENAAGIEAFEATYADMRDALDWLLDDGHADDAFRLSAAMTQFWMASKRVDEGMAWLQRALDTGEGSDAGRSRGLHDLGYLAFFAGGYDVAERRFAESRQLAERAGDRTSSPSLSPARLGSSSTMIRPPRSPSSERRSRSQDLPGEPRPIECRARPRRGPPAVGRPRRRP